MNAFDDPFEFCQNELKRLDPVRHFAALTATEKKRPSLFAFYAFLAELERIPQQVTEPAMGQVRLQWWRDLINEPSMDIGSTHTAPKFGPLGTAFKQTQDQYGLSTASLTQIVDAREFDLFNDPMPDIPTFEVYAGETEAIPYMLACQILNDGKTTSELADLCGHAGMAVSLGKHLFVWPETAASQRVFLPLESFVSRGATLQELLARKKTNNISNGVFDLCQLAEEHHFKAMAIYRSLGPSKANIAPAFLSLAPTKRKIALRKKAPTKVLRLSNWRAYFAIWRMAASS